MFSITLNLLIWRCEIETEQACRYMHIHTKKNRELWKTITCNKKQKKKDELIENTKESDQEDG